ncbi:MAG: type II CAAX endopeptidase family protein [Planctomycetota bacterium]
MDAQRTTIGRSLLLVTPFVAVIVVPQLIFLNVSTRVESRPTTVTIRYADGRTAIERKQNDIGMVDLRWRLGQYVLFSSTTTASIFAIQTGSSTLGEGAGVALMRARSWGAVVVFPIALLLSWLIRPMAQSSSAESFQAPPFHPTFRIVGACMGLFCLFAIGFVFLEPLWPADVSELVRWYRFRVTGFIPLVSCVLVTPVAEELIFRAGVCRVLVERIGPVAGILLQAVVFASVHLATPLHAAVGFAGGVVLGMVYVRCRSLAASVFLHAGANGVLAVACQVVA